MKRGTIVIIGLCILILVIALNVPDKVGKLFENDVVAATEPSLVMMAKDSSDINCTVYVYRYTDGAGNYYTFVAVSRNFKDGAAVTQLK